MTALVREPSGGASLATSSSVGDNSVMSSIAICNPSYRAGDPDFGGSAPLSGRLLFVRRGTNVTWVWGGTGYLVITLAWEAFLASLPPGGADVQGVGGFGAYGVTGSAERKTYRMNLGQSTWDADFTRALWSFCFRAWQSQATRLRHPSAIDQFTGRASADYTQDWMAKLNAIRSVELTRTITPAAFKLAATAALSRQNLLDNVTTPLVQLLPRTMLPLYEVALRPNAEIERNNRSALIWPATGPFPNDPRWANNDGRVTYILCDEDGDSPAATSSSPPATTTPRVPTTPSRPAVTTGSSTSSPLPTNTSIALSAQVAFPDPRDTERKDSSKPVYTAVYVLGGAMLAAGAGWAAFSAFREGSSERF